MAATAPSVARPRAAPQARPGAARRVRPRRGRARARRSSLFGGVVWIVALAALLAGVVALNVAVLQLNLRSDSLDRERAELRDGNASLQAQLSRAAANTRLESIAQRQLGLVLATPGQRTDLVLEP